MKIGLQDFYGIFLRVVCKKAFPSRGSLTQQEKIVKPCCALLQHDV